MKWWAFFLFFQIYILLVIRCRNADLFLPLVNIWLVNCAIVLKCRHKFLYVSPSNHSILWKFLLSQLFWDFERVDSSVKELCDDPVSVMCVVYRDNSNFFWKKRFFHILEHSCISTIIFIFVIVRKEEREVESV